MRDVAAAAGIKSPGLIYHYFENKEVLFQAVVTHYAPPLQGIAQSDTLAALPVREGLMQIARMYLGTLQDDRISACIRTMMGEALRSPKFAGVLGEAGPQRIWTALAGYLKRQMDLGSLRPVDPHIAARYFISPLFTYVFVRTIARLTDTLELDADTFAIQCVDLFLSGCGPLSSG